jgi:hypothetical protein
MKAHPLFDRHEKEVCLTDKKSHFGRFGHTPVKASREKRFHGEKLAGIVAGSQDQENGFKECIDFAAFPPGVRT